MPDTLLLRVADSLTLTGLGVLLLPAAAASPLAALALHTTLALRLRYPGGTESPAAGSVEEVARPGAAAVRAVLLTQAGATPPPAGTEVWWTGSDLPESG